jgi:hypothetical protein
MAYKYEFPDFDYELPNLGKGWEDNSWHNDSCPSLDYPLNGEEIVRIWFDYANPEYRECGGDRYTLAVGIYGQTLEGIHSSENLEEILAYIKAQNIVPFKEQA